MKRELILKYLMALLAVLVLSGQAAAMEISNELSGLVSKGNNRVVEAPTQFGASVGGIYTFGSTWESWHSGPGLFFDYKLANFVTVSAEVFMLMNVSGDPWIDKILKPGFYAKHWVSESWGYTGIGIDAVLITESSGDSHFELMLSLLVTGENLSLGSRINSTGDLKLSVTVLDTSSAPETRFSVMYNLGIGFDMSESPKSP